MVDPTVRFAELVAEAGGGGAPHLDQLALAIAAHARPDLDVAAQLDRLDAIAATCPATHGAALCRWLAIDEGFRGNAGEYYDPRNSLLDRVIDRRLGIPISLSVLAIEVGRRLGIALVPVGMPGHFLIRERADATAFYDPYGGGAALDLDGCAERFARIHGPAARFEPELLSAVDHVSVAARMLANLHNVYLQRAERSNLAWVLRLRVVLDPSDPSLRRQLAGVLAASGVWWEAAEELDRLAALQPERAAEHLAAAARLRARDN